MTLFSTRSLDDVLGELAVPVTDAPAVSAHIVGVLAARRRRVRLAAAAAATVALLVAVAALAMVGSDSPTEVVSADDPAGDREMASTTTTTGSESATGSGTVVTAIPTTSVLVAPGVTAPVTVTIAPAATLPSPPPTPATGLPAPSPGPGASPTGATAPPPPTSDPPPPSDAPMVGTLRVTPAAAAEVVTVELDWSDPDAPGNAAAEMWVTAVSGGDRIEAKAGRPGSCAGPPPAGGTVSTGLRLPTAGTWELYVDVSLCGSENVRFTDTVAIGAPGGGRRGVIVRADGFDPETGTWSYLPDAGELVALRSDPGAPDGAPDNDPSVRMSHGGRPVTVLAIPTADGRLLLQGPGCREAVVTGTEPVLKTKTCPS